MILDYFKIAVKNLGKRKLRTLLTMIGIFVSIATIFVLISLSLGLQGAVKEQFEALGTDKFFVIPGTGFLGPPGSVGGVILTEKDVEVVKKVRGVADLSYVTVANAEVEFVGQTKFFPVIGLPLGNIDVFKESGAWTTEDGLDLEEGDLGKAMMGSLFKTGNIFKKPVKPGDIIRINGERFKVSGIAKPLGNPGDDSTVLIPLEDLREIFNIPKRVDQIIVKVNEGEDVLEVAERTGKKLRQTRDVTEKTQDFIISTPEELLGSFQNILNIITVFLAGVAAISLFVGAIGIANTMYTSVLERTREIGVMKAIGAKNKDILMIFLIESGLLGLVGAIIGVGLGYGIAKTLEYIAINSLNTTLLQVATPPYLVIGSLLFGFLIGAASGVFPAMGASKINVVDALRYE